MFRVFDKINNGEIYIIAEMSANHGGNLDTALKIVREAAKAGADCVKIQTYTADSINFSIVYFIENTKHPLSPYKLK